MVFSSNIFLFFFLPIFLGIYYLMPFKYKSYAIVFGSYTFYAWWRPDFMLLFLAVTVWSHFWALKTVQYLDSNPKRAKYTLWISIIGNLSTLVYFKYANFGVDTFSNLIGLYGLEHISIEQIILPLGISFYIFQCISYNLDIYQKDATPAKKFIDFAAYISLFPQLIAGPILRYKNMQAQFEYRKHTWELFSLGASRFMIGFIMKVLIADQLAVYQTYTLTTDSMSFSESLVANSATFMQLYFDFAGYACMAIGLGLMMGFRFAENFDHPYMAQSTTEFWKRWHMTLSDFLKNYITKPFLKCGVGLYSAIFLTMFISGIWHGASFAFICFGIYFGITMIIERMTNSVTTVESPYSFISNMRTHLLVVYCMPLFWTSDIVHSLEIYTGMLGMNGFGNLDNLLTVCSIESFIIFIIGYIWVFSTGAMNKRYYLGKTENYQTKNLSNIQTVIIWGLFLLAITRLAANSFSPFLYFQF